MSHNQEDENDKICVLLESPYAGDVETNVAYAKRCMKESLLLGEAPFASHLLYTQAGILDDKNEDERHIGISAGLAWGLLAKLTVVYIDLGLSEGMKRGIRSAKAAGRPVEYRKLGIGKVDPPHDAPL